MLKRVVNFITCEASGTDSKPKCKRVLDLFNRENSLYEKLAGLEAGIFDIYLLHPQATIFCKSRDFSYFQQRCQKSGLPSAPLLCWDDTPVDFLTKNDFGILNGN